MKLLLDQNLSYRLVYALNDAFPGSKHVRDFDMGSATDEEIWSFARDGGYVIVSKDSDFRHMSFVHGPPPKVGWVDLGNCTTERVLESLRRHGAALSSFGEDGEAAFLALGR